VATIVRRYIGMILTRKTRKTRNTQNSDSYKLAERRRRKDEIDRTAHLGREKDSHHISQTQTQTTTQTSRGDGVTTNGEGKIVNREPRRLASTRLAWTLQTSRWKPHVQRLQNGCEGVEAVLREGGGYRSAASINEASISVLDKG